MKRILIFIFFIVTQISQSQINNTDLKQLKNLVNEFDVVLKKYYPKTESNKAYQNYLEDLLQKKINPNIINEKNSFNAIKKFTEDSTFKKVWKLNPVKEENKKFIIDYNGDFYEYITKNCDQKNLKQSLLEFKKLNNNHNAKFKPSPYILVSVFTTYLGENDYDVENTKLAIAIMFYYDIIAEHKIK
ncbi:hypothetical protein F7018_01010 [Tenacibaculum aiptasiae]|uniref:Uncharacterized protein n=1 Tax=Tenacibaculum aiptasiae TaxID=426481 RepID=A0A7J5AS77_9FLAO|nr:hypothetical protein [Tenacibaculum aiptasiae]KAB1160486.1 hypothetical protein F7018_01010 [Tenacibaculum aiptasiae]